MNFGKIIFKKVECRIQKKYTNKEDGVREFLKKMFEKEGFANIEGLGSEPECIKKT